MKLWKNLFEPSIGESHLSLLVNHVDAFFTDIISETQEREKTIRDRIDSKFRTFGTTFKVFNLNLFHLALIQEKQDLERLLKEEANEVTSKVPLHTLQANIDDSLKELRTKLHTRREEIKTLLLQQEEICNGNVRSQLFLRNFCENFF